MELRGLNDKQTEAAKVTRCLMQSSGKAPSAVYMTTATTAKWNSPTEAHVL